MVNTKASVDWMNQIIGRADMHMHTRASDGTTEVQTLLSYIRDYKQLDVIAITDHDRLDASLWAYEHQDRYPFDVVPGVEVTSREGHVLAWWVTENIPSQLSLEETVQAIHEVGGLAILAHPFHLHVGESAIGMRRYLTHVALIEQIGFDGVEVVNAGTVIPGINLYAKLACRSLDVAFVGNSDAHTPNAVASGGTAFPGKTARDLRQAIQLKHTKPLGGIWSPAAYVSYGMGVLNGSIRSS